MAITFDLDADPTRAVLAFDEAIRSMEATKAASERLSASMGGMEAVANRAGVSTEQASRLIEQSVKRAAAEARKAQEDAARAAEKAAKDQERAAQRAAAALEREAKRAAAAQEREAQRAARAQEREAKRAAEAARKAAEMAGNSWNQVARRMQSNQLISDLEQLGGAFIPVGGAVSKVAMAFTSLVRPAAMLGTILGPSSGLLVGLAALPGAMALGSVAAHAFADAAVEARKRLEELGQKISKENREDLDDYAAAGERMAIATDRMAVALGAPIAAKLSDMSEMAAVAADKLRPLAAILEMYVDQQAPLGTAIADSLREPRKELIALTAAQKNLSASLAQGAAATKEAQEYAKALRDVHAQSDKLDKQAEESWAAKVKKDAKEAAQAQEKLGDIIREAGSDLLTAEGKVMAVRNERIAQVRELKITEEEAAMAIGEIERRAARDILAIDAERTKKRLDKLKDEAKEAAEIAKKGAELIARNEREINEMRTADAKQKAEERAAAEKSAREQVLTGMADLAVALTEINTQLHEEELERTRNRLERKREAMAEEWEAFRDATKDMTAEQRKAYRQRTKEDREKLRGDLERLQEQRDAQRQAVRDAFALQQAAAVGQVLINSAIAFSGLLASLSPLGIAAPVLATTIVGASTTASLAQIAAQKPPAHDGAAFGADEFYMGNRKVRDGESMVIFNQRATENGAPERAMAENRGERSGGGSGPARLVLADSGRVIGEAVVSEMRRPGSALAAAVGSTPRGFRDVYRKRR